MTRSCPPHDLLMTYAAGTASEGAGLVVATHLALCPCCRAQVNEMEQMGGALLERACGEQPVSQTCREKVMAMLDETTPPPSAITPTETSLCRVLPAPLRDYVGCGLSKVSWKKLTGAIDRIVLKECHEGRAQLMRIKAGSRMPEHGHTGPEYTLVLQGAYRDQGQLYRRGDVSCCSASTIHQPTAEATEDCICLVVTEGKTKPTGLLQRLACMVTGF